MQCNLAATYIIFNHINYYLFSVNCTSFIKIYSLVSEICNLKTINLVQELGAIYRKRYQMFC